jgi:hypothetical protein
MEKKSASGWNGGVVLVFGVALALVDGLLLRRQELCVPALGGGTVVALERGFTSFVKLRSKPCFAYKFLLSRRFLSHDRLQIGSFWS